MATCMTLQNNSTSPSKSESKGFRLIPLKCGIPLPLGPRRLFLIGKLFLTYFVTILIFGGGILLSLQNVGVFHILRLSECNLHRVYPLYNYTESIRKLSDCL